MAARAFTLSALCFTREAVCRLPAGVHVPSRFGHLTPVERPETRQPPSSVQAPPALAPLSRVQSAPAASGWSEGDEPGWSGAATLARRAPSVKAMAAPTSAATAPPRKTVWTWTTPAATSASVSSGVRMRRPPRSTG